MKLQELSEQVKYYFMVDEELKAKLYENRVEFYDYTGEVDLPEHNTHLNEMCCNILNLYFENNKIVFIENVSMKAITPANVKTFEFVLSLINKEIEDYKDYPIISKEDENKDFISL
jgi:hypothetical protein